MRRLTSGSVRDRDPAWSPDGQRIAFGSNRGGDYQLWTVRPDGQDVQLFVEHPTGAFAPVWSSTSDHLAWFTRGFEPFVSGAGGKRALPLPAAGEGFRPTDWAGDQIVGVVRTTDGGRIAIAIYSMTTGRYARLPVACESVRWWPGTSDLICAENRRLLRVESGTGRVWDLAVLPHEIANQFGISPDGTAIYVSLSEDQTELWTAVARK